MSSNAVAPSAGIEARVVTRSRRPPRNTGFAVSIPHRNAGEEIFGWLKPVGVLRKTRHRGTQRVGWMFTFSLAAYNLGRMRNLALAG